MIKELEKAQELCTLLMSESLRENLITKIQNTQEKLDLLHDAHGETNIDGRFTFEGQSLTYTTIAEHILYIEALKSVLVELVIYGKEHPDFIDTVYEMCDNYEINLKPYELVHGR